MSLLFSNPSILWALSALPALAVLLMVLPRTRKIRVSSLQFWTDANAEARVQQARRVRRLDAASALLLVVLGLLIIALAGPEVVGNESGAAALAIVVDRSPLLAAPVAGAGTQSRAELIGRRLDEFLSRLPQDMVLEMQFMPAAPAGAAAISADGAVEPAGADNDGVGGRYRGDVRQARRRLQEEYRPVDAGVDWQQLRQAAIAARDRLDVPVLLVTDVFPHEAGTGGLTVPTGVWLLTSGGNSRNAALTSAVVQQRRDGLWGMIEYAMCGRWDEVDQADGLLKVVPGDESGETGAAGEEFQTPVDFSSAAGAMTLKLPDSAAQFDTLRLLLDVEDDWPADNALRLRRVEVRQPKVVYLGRADENLLHLLAVAGAEVVRREIAEDDGNSGGAADLPANADVTFFVDRAPPADFRGAAIVVNPPGRVGPVTPGEFEDSVARLEAVPAPLKAILPDEIATIRRWRSAQAGPGVEPLLADRLTGRSVALRYESIGGGGPVVVVLADISAESTDWAERAGFPVFWRAMLDETMPAAAAHRLEFVVDGLRQRPLLTERCAGAAIDETAAAHRAALEVRCESRPTLTSLWPHVLLAALAALGVRLWLMR